MIKALKRKQYNNALMAGILALGLSACSPVIHNHGYVFDELDLSAIKRGETTMDGVKSVLGSPTTTSVIDNQTFYYIFSRYHTMGYREPVEMTRSVLAISFDDQKKVTDYKQYGLADGNLVAFVGRNTQTSGKELSAIEQLLGNLGRVGSGESGGPAGPQ